MKPSQLALEFGNPVAYYPGLVKHLGSVNSVLMFCQFFYWTGKEISELGIYKSVEEIEKETGLTYREQATARKQLVSRGVLIETNKRLEHRIYYRIDMKKLDEILTQAIDFPPNAESAVREMRKAQSGKDGKRSSGSAESAGGEVRKAQFVNTENTSENTSDIKDPPNPQGEEDRAQECLDYYNKLTGSRCQAIASFQKALNSVKSRGVCYSVEEVKLVILWTAEVWKHKATPANICRMTRFDNYLSEALIWAGGENRNPNPCPHEILIGLWNEKIPSKAIAIHEWNKRRPAYVNLEAVWNGKTNSGNWRESKHIGVAFDLIKKSSLFADAENKGWLSLDWILEPKNWARVYEQAINEHKHRKGITA
ncbi:DNA replication protein [Serratia sp. MF2]|uniref:DNA replication protein n=1 Tax=Serratia sp. MF2 TaxID=3059173 RepID=UPI0027ED6CC4|nr:DNA replication protein [Serratia sp. MF2]MDQ7101919.1 DNA replication protein [Serratia sp. MF2]